LQSVSGTVRDSAGTPLIGADIFLGRRQATTGTRGAFRIDSVRPGQYTITVRLVGYTPLSAEIRVGAQGSVERHYVLVPAPVLLPTIAVEGRRTGIYGVVADPSFHAAVGARVQVFGSRGGEQLTDSSGRFSFPTADRGVYLVRITYPGYGERRISVELKRGEGRELTTVLTPSSVLPFRGDEWALKDLRLRLAMGMRRERMTADELKRFGSTPVCEIPLEGGGAPVIIVNGLTVYRDMPLRFLCFWRADQVELVESGPDVCREVTRTLAYLIYAWCSATREVPRSIMGGQRLSTHGGSRGSALIWEKK
jgi:hypothetical protein